MITSVHHLSHLVEIEFFDSIAFFVVVFIAEHGGVIYHHRVETVVPVIQMVRELQETVKPGVSHREGRHAASLSYQTCDRFSKSFLMAAAGNYDEGPGVRENLP